MYFKRMYVAGEIFTCLILIGLLQINVPSALAQTQNFGGSPRIEALVSSANPSKVGFASREFTIADRDFDRVNEFEIILLLRLYAIAVDQTYATLSTTRVGDWRTMITTYKQAAELCAELEKFKGVHERKDVPVSQYFAAQQSFYILSAELSAEIERTRISSITSNQMFLCLRGDSNACTLVYPKPDRPLIQKWGARMSQAYRAAAEAANDLKARLKGVYGLELGNITGYKSERFPFLLPLEEFGSESDYLYEAFIRDTDLNLFLKAYFKRDLVRLSTVLINETQFNLQEIGLFVMDIASVRLKATAFADYLISIVIECSRSNMKAYRRQNYEDAKDLHDQVIKQLRLGSEELASLRTFVEQTVNRTPFNGGQLQAGRALISMVTNYLNQREDLRGHVLKTQLIAIRALHRFNLADGDMVIDREIAKLVKLGLGKRISTLTPTPCEFRDQAVNYSNVPPDQRADTNPTPPATGNSNRRSESTGAGLTNSDSKVPRRAGVFLKLGAEFVQLQRVAPSGTRREEGSIGKIIQNLKGTKYSESMRVKILKRDLLKGRSPYIFQARVLLQSKLLSYV